MGPKVDDSTTNAEPHILDNPVWAALTGPQSPIAEVNGLARRYLPEVSPFSAITDVHDPQAWRDLAELIGSDGTAVLTGRLLNIPDDWQVLGGGTGVQLIGDAVEGREDDEALALGVDDVPEMLDLVSRTQPGPFLPRTIELGGYLGFRIDGALVAIAGCRVHPTGWREISTVCTDPAHQGKGLAGRLVRAVAAGIRAEGDLPFLHASTTNENAIRLYEALGFRLRSRSTFAAVKAPSTQDS